MNNIHKCISLQWTVLRISTSNALHDVIFIDKLKNNSIYFVIF